jgi:hypothetical protein
MWTYPDGVSRLSGSPLQRRDYCDAGLLHERAQKNKAGNDVPALSGAARDDGNAVFEGAVFVSPA